MKYFIRKLFGLILIIGFFSGCASMNRQFRDVEEMVSSRQEVKLHRSHDQKEDEKVRKEIEASLKEELTAEKAVRIALLNNPDLQATFQGLGIARADLLQAGLLKNPRFHNFIRFPKDGEETNIEIAIDHDVLDLIYMPLRRRVAAAEMDAAKLRVADAVLSLVAEVKTAYYELVAAEQARSLQNSVLEAAEAAAELGGRLHQAGNIKALDFENEKAAYRQAEIDFVKSEEAVLNAEEPLRRFLGFSGKEDWHIANKLPDLPATEIPLNRLEEQALKERLDLAGVKKQVEALRKKLLATRLGVLQNSEFGFNWEKDTDGEKVAGPEWGVDVPVFDWQQAAGARAKAELLQSEFAAQSFEIQVLSDVRTARNRLIAARTITEKYQENIIPIRQEIVRLMQQQYNYMLEGVFELLLTKQNEITAHREYIENLKEYWIARAGLERAVGGKLPKVEEETVKAVSKPEPAAQQQPMKGMHHDHGGGHQ